MVVEERVVRAVKPGRQHGFGDSHPDTVGETLAKRPRGGFYARRVTHFWVPRCRRTKLPERFQVIDGYAISAQVQNRIQQHGPMTVGQYETVAVGPGWVCRVMTQNVTAQL